MFNKLSLKTKIMGMGLGICVVLGGSGMLLVQRLEHSTEKERIVAFGGFAKTLDLAIEAQFYERYGDVQAFALNPGILSPSRKEIVDFLNAYAAMYGIYDLIMIVDTRGNLVAVNDKDPAGKALDVKPLYSMRYADTPWFQNALSGKFTQNKEKAFDNTYVEDPAFDPMVSKVYGEERYGNSFTAQVKDKNGKLIGVISNRAGFRWAAGEFKNLYDSVKKFGAPSAEMVLVNGEGKPLFKFNPSKNGGKLDPVYDKEVLGKEDLIGKGFTFVKDLIENKEADETIVSPEDHREKFAGLSFLDDGKFPEALKWGVYVVADREEVMASILSAQKSFILVFGLFSALAGFILWLFSDRIGKSFSSLIGTLATGAQRLGQVSQTMNETSQHLSDGVSKSAAAIQETAAAIDEVSAMVKKNSENASRSREKSNESRTAAEEGKQSTDEMNVAIGEIATSNQEIMKQVEAGNQEIGEIVKVIGEIGTKTKVINDIVFQTKLLSFNASVEAARAGEHGKGFAVVAEEVGNLAQMSGNAAKEISTMLDESIKRVETIVNGTRTKVQGLIQLGTEKVKRGTEVTLKCTDVLSKIHSSISDLDSMVAEISAASGEQSTGVSEINKAISQLNEGTQQNSGHSAQNAGISKSLNEEAKELRAVIDHLQGLVMGGKDVKLSPKVTAKPKLVQAPKVGAQVTSIDTARKKKVISAKPTTPISTVNSGSLKKAAGAEGMPTSDDPRFEEV